jgi:hypothetical protein
MPIPYSQLIDGRLTKFGVRIEIPTNTANDRRCLVGRDGNLWAYRLDDGSCSFGRFAGSLPFSVLDAIEEEFATQLVNQGDHRYWGFASREDMEGRYDEILKEDEDEFYKNVICYVRGEPHGLGSGTIGMIKARIAKAVVERKPALVAPENRDEFLKIVEDLYSSDAQNVVQRQ